MPFNRARCVIPTIYCGKQAVPPANQNYTRVGTPYECLKKGFGGGKFGEQANNAPANSLMKIKYIGTYLEGKFKAVNINNMNQLRTYMKGRTAAQKRTQLRNILVNTNGVINQRAYNSVLLWLNDKGIGRLPTCYLIH